MEKLSIGKMAELNQVSVQTLRLYDKLGILAPIEVNPETGYRYYDIKQSGQLDMIQYMKDSGMTLKEIRQVLKNRDYTALEEVLHKRIEEIDLRLAELTTQKRSVKRMLNSFDRYLKSPGDGTITLEYIGERKLYARQMETNFYEYGLEMYENILKSLKKEMERCGIDKYYYYNAGTTVTKEHFKEEKCISSQIFVFVDQDYVHKELTYVPANMYACMYCDDFEKEEAYIHRLHKHIRENKMQIIGDYMCEVLAELPVTQSNKREMFLRLQVPVKV